MILGPVILGILPGALAFGTLWSTGALIALIGAQLVASMTVALGAVLLARNKGVDAVSEDRRKATREDTFARGRIEFTDGRPAIHCIIHDLSGAGARLGIPDGTKLPEFFNLYSAGVNRTMPAKVRWCTFDQVGIAFVDAPAASVGDREAWPSETGKWNAG